MRRAGGVHGTGERRNIAFSDYYFSFSSFALLAAPNSRYLLPLPLSAAHTSKQVETAAGSLTDPGINGAHCPMGAWCARTDLRQNKFRILGARFWGWGSGKGGCGRGAGAIVTPAA